MDRAAFLSGAVGLAAALGSRESTATLADLEARYGGRLGVAALNAGTGARLMHRSGERFPMCSTFKVLLVAATLARVDTGSERLDQHVPYGNADLLTYAPITRANASRGFMTLGALCEAVTEYSDNTAANLLLRTVGGPPAVTAYARSLGDTVTRLDRTEPSLNTAFPGDSRDTTAPAAMVADLRKLLTGSALSTASRRKLKSWLLASKTGTERIRAGVPAGWSVGDKTGTGDNATSNDVAVIYPPGRSPIFVAAYYTGSSATVAERNAVLSGVGRLVSSGLT